MVIQISHQLIGAEGGDSSGISVVDEIPPAGAHHTPSESGNQHCSDFNTEFSIMKLIQSNKQKISIAVGKLSSNRYL